MAETKVKEAPAVDPMIEILSRAIPEKLKERLKQLEEEHESNYRLHPDMVAVLDVSTNAASLNDGVPPTYDVVTGSPLDREIRGDKSIAEFTVQGLRVTDRYTIVYNFVPKTEYIYKYTIIPLKEWEKYIAGRQPGMMTTAQELAGLVLRSGGAI